ncbi:sugar ABC transporter substrate-binding protein [Oceanirhabdus sp. W0125-5]|uniref:sugar ABC transporter substrate-binding protein n=1 Tax=Oceanirhabdus sp. W0125-5 TaxID=2999116 RepID=UPI0022F34949|nr:sugar ABC transporter substrate-binding protein [Oceanirhabdus sp. W0125-5]WBW99081.1 sugar ABC transporter substrate-binding protein [Oceanirhabdus sp. W0125-5]
MKRKLFGAVMAAVFVVGTFSGCKSDDKPTENVSNIKTIGTNDYGWEIPEKTFEFSFYQKGQINPDDTEKTTKLLKKYILDEFNVKINKIVYDTDANERFNLMLSSGKYPEVMTGLSKADVVRLQQLGKLKDITSYVDKYGSNIKNELGDYYNRYLDEDNKLYKLPYAWGLLPIPDYSAHIRLDWYKELGKPKFETPEEYYEILKKMVDKHPKDENGKKTYALSWNQYCSINTIAGVWGLKNGYKEDNEHNLTHWINTSEGREFTEFYNKVYRDGMLDPDSFTNKYDDWKAKFSGERIAGHIGPWWQSWNAGHEVWQKLDKKWSDEQRYVQVKLKDKDADKAYLSPKDTTGWGYTVITDKCKNPEMIIKFLNAAITPNGTRLFAWGVPNLENSNWNFKDGKWSFNQKSKEEIINTTYDYEEHDLLGPNKFWLIHPQGAMSDNLKVNAWIDQCFNDEAKWKKIMNDNLRDTVYDNSAMSQIDFLADNPITVKKQQVKDIIDTYWAKTVLSKTEKEFNKNYEDMKKKLIKAGVNELQKYMTEQYKINVEKWGK